MKPTDGSACLPEDDPLAFDELEDIIEELERLEKEWLSREGLDAGEDGDPE